MKMVALFFLLLISTPSLANEIDSERIDQLSNIMMKTCPTAQDIRLSVESDGSLALSSKGFNGQFSASKSEIPSIIKVLEKEIGNSEGLEKTRECYQYYMNKIYDVILASLPESSEVDFPVFNEHGIIYELKECKKAEKNDLSCEFVITSSFQNRYIFVAAEGGTYGYIATTLYDQLGNEYKASRVEIANHTNRSNYGITNIKLVADLPMKMSIYFANVSTQISRIALLEVSTEVNLNNKSNRSLISYKDIALD